MVGKQDIFLQPRYTSKFLLSSTLTKYILIVSCVVNTTSSSFRFAFSTISCLLFRWKRPTLRFVHTSNSSCQLYKTDVGATTKNTGRTYQIKLNLCIITSTSGFFKTLFLNDFLNLYYCIIEITHKMRILQSNTVFFAKSQWNNCHRHFIEIFIMHCRKFVHACKNYFTNRKAAKNTNKQKRICYIYKLIAQPVC